MLLLPATVTHGDAPGVLRMLELALKREADGAVVIDASPLLHFDSSALAVLLECRRLAQAWGKAFRVDSAPPKLAQLAGLYGVAELVAVRSTEPDRIASAN